MWRRNIHNYKMHCICNQVIIQNAECHKKNVKRIKCELWKYYEYLTEMMALPGYVYILLGYVTIECLLIEY